MDSNVAQEKIPIDYFVFIVVFSVPFWLLGGRKLPLPINLPASALMFVCPLLAATLLTYVRHGGEGVKRLLKKAVDFHKVNNKLWYVAALFLMPGIMVLSYWVMRWAGIALPEPNVPVFVIPLFILMFLPAAICEELGWMGYANDPMQSRWGALTASLVIGVFWALWHALPYVQTGNSAQWIIWQCLASVGLRVLISWIYNNAGLSVVTAILFHDMLNVSDFVFPNYGSHYDPFVTGFIIFVAVAVVIIGWGPKTLGHFRYANAF